MRPFLMVSFVVACGGDDGNVPVDALVERDAPATATVMEVACTGAEPRTTTANDTLAYAPSTRTIVVNEAIRFVNSSNHNVAPAATMSDPGLDVGFGETKCLKFTRAGTFRFRCSVPGHNFMGTVTVN